MMKKEEAKKKKEKGREQRPERQREGQRETGRNRRQGREGVVENKEKEEWDMKKGTLLHDLNSS